MALRESLLFPALASRRERGSVRGECLWGACVGSVCGEHAWGVFVGSVRGARAEGVCGGHVRGSVFRPPLSAKA